jgi:hypothetical protein
VPPAIPTVEAVTESHPHWQLGNRSMHVVATDLLGADGNRTAPDQVWNDGFGAGGGLSVIFRRPNWGARRHRSQPLSA